MVEGDALAFGLEEAPRKLSLLTRKRRELRLARFDEKAFANHKESSPRKKTEIHVDALPDLSNRDWHRMIERGSDFIDKGKFHFGISVLLRVVNRVPKNAEAWHKLGFAYGQLGRRDEAINCFDKVLSIDSRNREAWSNRGWNYLKKKMISEAIRDFKHALSIDPRSAQTWSNLGQAYLKSKDSRKAVEAFKMACSFDEFNEVHWYNLGLSQSRSGDRKNAIKSFGQACSINPAYFAGWLQLGLRVRSFKDWPKRRQSKGGSLAIQDQTDISVPNVGTVLSSDRYWVSKRPDLTQARLQATWELVQNPVAWIVVLVFASLLYILLGK